MACYSLEPCNFQSLEQIDRVIQTSQTVDYSALFLCEMMSMFGQEMFPYLLWPGPLDTTDEALR